MSRATHVRHNETAKVERACNPAYTCVLSSDVYPLFPNGTFRGVDLKLHVATQTLGAQDLLETLIASRSDH